MNGYQKLAILADTLGRVTITADTDIASEQTTYTARCSDFGGVGTTVEGAAHALYARVQQAEEAGLIT